MAQIQPFRESDAATTFSNLIENVLKEIRSLENEHVLKASREKLEAYYITKVRVNPLILHADDYYIIKQSGTKVDVSGDRSRGVSRGERASVHGTQLEIGIPFEGDSRLWNVRPSTFSLSGYPPIIIQDEQITLKYSFADDSVDPARLKSEIDNSIRTLGDAVENLKRDVVAHNKGATQIIKAALEDKFSAAKATIGVVSALGIPIKRREQPHTYTIPAKRRPSPVKPRVATEPSQPRDPELDIEEYDHILEICRSMALVIERNPKAFASLDEPTIRTHFLLQLNGHYEGLAHGELFNVSGSTDILIRIDNRNVFIAECKFWIGAGAFNRAIDQVLGYLAWRDTKCALLIFNRTKDIGDVKRTMHRVMQARPEYKKTVFHRLDGDSRYILVKESDPDREIIITTQVYDLGERYKKSPSSWQKKKDLLSQRSQKKQDE